MKTIKLSDRLAAVAAFIKPGAGVIDVGTDHGFLPAFLIQNGLARRVVASDINIGPLRRAMSTADSFGAADAIEFVHTDGLQGIDPAGIDTVVMAGMGGETMVDVLGKAGWVCNEGVRLILQPQSKLPELIHWLKENGLAIRDATLAEDDGKLYMVLCVEQNIGEPFREPFAVLLDKRDSLLPKYLDREITKAQRIVAGLEKAADGPNSLPEAAQQLQRLLECKEEIRKWQL
jgi:tRNA (adenine22-N1)-methyltransferase